MEVSMQLAASMASVTAPALRGSGGPLRAYRRRWFSRSPPQLRLAPQPRRRALKLPAPRFAGRLAPPRLRGFELHSRGRADKTT
ncbi:hypothetical protein B5X24_HaOG210362 [Helicoverpa armigera]|uniref:Uncharacterized protein n=1 Tax=Helicoverpa armigera TaxID=29058 RepID=A0A2W1BI81_HELAM|nr:hypothetical protein B5X24_HaOG210362 [Helicoverpa armigera]